MAIRPEEITSIIRSEIDTFDAAVETRSVGTVVEIGDGIAQIYGLEDAVAGELVDRAAGELAAAAASVIRRLDMRGDPFPTILAGGIFRGLPSLIGKVAEHLAEIAPRSDVRQLTVEPALGAVTLALAAARGPVAIPAYV